jgi:mono/diheme cytochrome c family protein
VNTRLLVAGCVAVMSVALVSAQSQQGLRQSTPAPNSTVGTQAKPQAPAANTKAAPPADVSTQRALIDQYCVTCHNSRAKTANLLLDQLDIAHLGAHAEIAEKVVRKLRAGLMPPANMKRPDPATMEAFIRWMENELDRNAVTHFPPPGLHRLNRTEYANAIRDVLALDVDAAKFLPSDDSTRGFDNIAGALTMSPALMEAYLSAAGKISRLAIGDISAPRQEVFEAPADTAQNHHIEGLPFGTRGGMLIKYEFPADGEYTFKVKGVTGYFQAVLGQIKGEQLEVTVDGERVKLFDWDREISNTTGVGRTTPRVPIKAGLHTVGVTFLATNDVPGTELNKPFQRTMNTPGTIPGFQFYPHVGQVTIEGPYGADGSTDTPSRRKIFVCRPATSREEGTCARTIISTLVKHAFRRPSTPADLELLMEFYLAGRNEGESFDQGVQSALQRILADPEFVYRGENEPAGLAAGKTYRVGDLALASRLSFFLWSSIPDDELLDLAIRGKLRDAGVLDQQVRRMLEDPRARTSLVENFFEQWLEIRNVWLLTPDANQHFPWFDDNLRIAFVKEMDLFFNAQLKEDRSIVDLLTANFTFVNEQLARHYGISGVYGSHFRRVTLTDENRWGLLGKAAVLSVTSYTTRTSPTIRGKWLLENILGAPVPPPPPNVPALEASNKGDRPLSVREMLETHRKNPTCAGCHARMDPLGFSLENFDGIGQWRTTDAGTPIDASGVLLDGTKVEGPVALRQALVAQKEQFVRAVTAKLVTYALGREIEFFDAPAIREIVRAAAADNYKWSSAILAIVKSAPFQMRRAGS